MLIKKIKLYKQEISAFLLVLLAFFPVYPQALQSISLIVFSLFSIVFYFSNFKERIKVRQNNINFLCITGYILWAIFSVLWSNNKANLLSELQPSLILLLLPFVVIYFCNPITKKLRIIVFVTFIISNLILSLYLYNFIELGTARWMSFYKGDTFLYESNSLLGNLKYLYQITYKWSYSYGNFMEVSNGDFHKAYMSSSFLISIALSLFLIFKTKSKFMVKIILIAVVLYFSTWLLYMKSLVNLLAYACFVVFLILELRTNKLKLIAALAILLAMAIAVNIFKEDLSAIYKDKQLFQEEYIPMYDEGYILDYERTKIYKTTYDLLSKPQTFLVGVGYPDSEIELNKQLDKYPEFSKTNWNTHSEILHFWLSGGVINLLLLFLLFGFLFYKALKGKNSLLLCFATIILFNIFFENYMSRVMGAYIVAFFLFILPKNNLIEEYNNI